MNKIIIAIIATFVVVSGVYLSYCNSNKDTSQYKSYYNSKESSISSKSREISVVSTGYEDGFYWNTLSSSDKRNIVKFYLQNIRNGNFIINQSETWFIEALDSFYNDDTSQKYKIHEAISYIGIKENVIFKP